MSIKKIWPVILFSLLIMAVFLAGLFLGNQVIPVMSPKDSLIDSDYIIPFNDAWKSIHDQYLNQPVNDQNLMEGAIRGMLESLNDPYSAYMDPAEYESQSAPLEGEYTGIGAWVDTTGDLLVIISPMPDSPAERVGIMPGDIVIGINGENVTSLDPASVLKKILGPAGTSINLIIRRNEETLEFTVERAVIQVPSVESKMIDDEIGYIRLYNFGANSSDEVSDALAELRKQGAEKLIFDLRNNSGGYVDSAVDITSFFIESGDILIEEWGDGSQKVYKHSGRSLDTKSPMAVLINEGSASASEIMAGALQDYSRAVLIGVTSYGKGYIQIWDPLPNDFGAIRLTIARWLTPNGRQIQEEGLAPNISIEFSEEDMETLTDSQLNGAIEYLKNLG